MAANFGAGNISDAFVIAMSVPSVVLALIGGAVSSTFIPQFTMIEEGKKNRFASNVVSLLLVVGIVFSIVFTIFPEVLVRLFASRLGDEAFVYATNYLRIMVWSAVPILLVGVFRGYLQIKNAFFIAMISDVLINIFLILSIVTSKALNQIYLLGFGALAGNFATLFVLMLFSRKNGLNYKPVLDFKDPGLLSMEKLMLPIFISSAVSEINQIIDKNLASSLVSGTVSSLNYSSKINNVIIGLIGGSVATVLFPRMSELAAGEDKKSLKRFVVFSISHLFPLLLPMTVGIFILAMPVIRILLERGAFRPEDTIKTAECLRMYVIGLMVCNFNQVLGRSFQAMRKVKISALISSIALTVGIILNLILIGPMKHMGLSLATSTSNTVSFVLLMIVLRKYIGPLGFNTKLKEYAKIIFSVVVMGVVVYFVSARLDLMSISYIRCTVLTIILALSGAFIYGALMLLLKAEIAWELVNFIFSMLRRFLPMFFKTPKAESVAGTVDEPEKVNDKRE
jgi:putative peptidoglycan lipid II flippase